MDTQIDRPTRFLEWAVTTFGDVALNPAERLMRFVEEAVELAYASEMPRETMGKIIDRVYARHQGNIELEAAQCQVTLELLAKVWRIDLDKVATDEFYRVQSIPKEEWARRHGAKVALGIARQPHS